jgi:hypothetical protein
MRVNGTPERYGCVKLHVSFGCPRLRERRESFSQKLASKCEPTLFWAGLSHLFRFISVSETISTTKARRCRQLHLRLTASAPGRHAANSRRSQPSRSWAAPLYVAVDRVFENRGRSVNSLSHLGIEAANVTSRGESASGFCSEQRVKSMSFGCSVVTNVNGVPQRGQNVRVPCADD